MGEGGPSFGGAIGRCATTAWATRWPRLVLGNLAVAVGYSGLAMLGSAVQYTGSIEAVWLPVGFAAAMLYIGDLRWWVGGAFADLVIGPTFIPFDHVSINGQDVMTTVGNTIEFTVAAILMRRLLGSRNRLERPVDVLSLFVAIGIGTALSAVIGTLALLWQGGLPLDQAFSSLRTWWLGDTSGGMLVAPLMLVWWNGPRRLDLRPRARCSRRERYSGQSSG